MNPPMAKQVYAQGGKAGVSRSRFVEQWRDHGGRAMMFPDYFDLVVQYVQSDVLPAATRQVGGDNGYFGVGELCYPDSAARDKAQRAPSRAEKIVPHGQAIFGHPRPIAMPVEFHDTFRRRQGMVKVYAFLAPRSDEPRDVFAARWSACSDGIRDALLADPATCAHGRGRSIDAASEFAGVEEMEFDTADAAVSYIQHHYRAAIGAFASARILVTEQIVMYKRSNYR